MFSLLVFIGIRVPISHRVFVTCACKRTHYFICECEYFGSKSPVLQLHITLHQRVKVGSEEQRKSCVILFINNVRLEFWEVFAPPRRCNLSTNWMISFSNIAHFCLPQRRRRRGQHRLARRPSADRGSWSTTLARHSRMRTSLASGCSSTLASPTVQTSVPMSWRRSSKSSTKLVSSWT